MENKKIYIFGGIIIVILIIASGLFLTMRPKEDRTEVYNTMFRMIDGIIGYEFNSIEDYTTIDNHTKIKRVLDKIEYFDLFEFECDEEFCYLDEEKFSEEYLILFGQELDFDLSEIEGSTSSGCSSNTWNYDKEIQKFKRNSVFVDGCDPFGQGYFIVERFGKEVKDLTEIHSKISYQLSRYNEETDEIKCHLYKDSRYEEGFAVLDYACDDPEKRDEIMSFLKENQNELYTRIHVFKEKDGLITVRSYMIK